MRRTTTVAVRCLASRSKRRPGDRYRATTPSQAPPPPPPPKDDGGPGEWLNSAERTAEITKNEKWIAGLAVVSCTAAIAMFTWTKWEVERRVQQLPDDHRQQWYDGSYQVKRQEEQAEREAEMEGFEAAAAFEGACLLYTSPSPRDQRGSRMPSSA